MPFHSSDPREPESMSEMERLDEVAGLLATGIMRARAIQQACGLGGPSAESTITAEDALNSSTSEAVMWSPVDAGENGERP